MPRSLVHVLLSLLLLLSQQAAVLHVTGDWGRAGANALAHVQGQAQLKSQNQGAQSPALPAAALDDACALCMDSAQLAFALPLPALAFAALSLSFDTAPGACNAGIRLLTTCVFQPRGPPRAR